MYRKRKHIKGILPRLSGDYPDSLRILSADRSIIREAYPAYPPAAEDPHTKYMPDTIVGFLGKDSYFGTPSHCTTLPIGSTSRFDTSLILPHQPPSDWV